MRIRQVRQDFWTDEKVAHLPDAVRLFYIGLWCVADDMGWFRWDVPRIGALLYPYRPQRRRERDVSAGASRLVELGRLVLHPCECAEIPTLPRHQVIGGTKSKGEFERHKRHLPDAPGTPGLPAGRGYGTVEGTERNGRVQTRERANDDGPSEFRRKTGIPVALGGDA